MRVDEVGPAMMRHQAIQRGEITADLPLSRGDTGERGQGGFDVHGCAILGDDGEQSRLWGGRRQAGCASVSTAIAPRRAAVSVWHGGCRPGCSTGMATDVSMNASLRNLRQRLPGAWFVARERAERRLAM